LPAFSSPRPGGGEGAERRRRNQTAARFPPPPNHSVFLLLTNDLIKRTMIDVLGKRKKTTVCSTPPTCTSENLKPRVFRSAGSKYSSSSCRFYFLFYFFFSQSSSVLAEIISFPLWCKYGRLSPNTTEEDLIQQFPISELQAQKVPLGNNEDVYIVDRR